jgi:hypothetical protein
MAASDLLGAPSPCALAPAPAPAAPAPAAPAPARRAGPSRELYARVAARPALLAEEPGLAADFSAAPWLLPPRFPDLDYVGATNLLELAALRAKTIGKHARAISVLFYSSAMSEMAQNAIYTMVKFGAVDNYLVAAWTPEDLDECRDLNLPCADASAHLPRPLRRGPSGELDGAAGEFTESNYLSQVWLKPAVVRALLEAGFVVHSTGARLQRR